MKLLARSSAFSAEPISSIGDFPRLSPGHGLLLQNHLLVHRPYMNWAYLTWKCQDSWNGGDQKIVRKWKPKQTSLASSSERGVRAFDFGLMTAGWVQWRKQSAQASWKKRKEQYGSHSPFPVQMSF
eukprot:RCo021326